MKKEYLLVILILLLWFSGCARLKDTKEVQTLAIMFLTFVETGETGKLGRLFIRPAGQEIPALEGGGGNALDYSLGAVNFAGANAATITVTLQQGAGQQTLLLTAEKQEGQWLLSPDIQLKHRFEKFIPLERE